MSKWLERARQQNAAPLPPPAPPSWKARFNAPAAPAPPPPPPPPPPNNRWLDAVREAAKVSGADRVLSSVDEDLLRILSLPYIPPGVQRCPNREEYAAQFYNHARPADFLLRDIQIDACYTYHAHGGLLAPVGVGHGKTLISLLASKIALEHRGHQRVAIMVPPEVFSQLVHRDLPWARRRLALDSVPFYVVTGGRQERMRTASTPGSGVFIYSYSSLSTETGYAEMAAMCPTCFICDEAQNLASEKSARTKRWHSIFREIAQAVEARRMGPDVRAQTVEAVVMSGTITKKRLNDYAHLSRVSLRDAAPTPVREVLINTLGSCIDSDVLGTGLGELDMERMQNLIQWARENGCDPGAVARQRGVPPTFQEMVREAYSHRLRCSPGVVATNDMGVDCSLIISWSEPPRPKTPESEHMAALMKKVVQDMETPNGDPIEYGMHTYKWLWELTAGFYNSLIWPTIDQIKKQHAGRGKPITDAEAEMLLHQALTHHKLLQVYHKLLRRFLDGTHQPGVDTPMLVAAEIVRQLDGHEPKCRIPSELIQAYHDQREARYDDLPERYSIPIRVCDYKIVAAVEWCKAIHKKGCGGLVWFHHPEVGRWIHERLEEAGIPHTAAFAGDNEAAFNEGIVLASYAHGTGKNLQHQSHNLIVELRREAAVMEQMLGRTHRSGQKADDVRADVFVSNGFDVALFNAILSESDYIQSTTGQQQRLCYATYSPIIPPTHPRLAVRLGIIANDQEQRSVRAGPWETVTPPEALDWTDVFRSLQWTGAKG